MRQDLLRRLRADRETGRLGTLETYQFLFPDAGAEVAEAYAEVSRGTPDMASSGSGVGEAASRSTIGLDELSDRSRERLRVVSEIGRGGMGVVLEVEDALLRRTLAMKRIHSGEEGAATDGTLAALFVRRLLEEAQVTSQLDHPGVVPVHELGIDPAGRVYFTMKRVLGRTLERVLADRAGGEAWPLSRALQVFIRICETLAYAHRKGVVHRDVKPANVMVGRFGEVYLMDWGIAKVRGDATPEADATSAQVIDARSLVHTRLSDRLRSGGDTPLTQDGEMVGTVGYMPPEQVLGAPVDERADVYAVGAMLYELLAGHAPFRDPDAPGGPRAFWERLAHGEPTPLAQRAPDAPPELVSIATKALAKDPARRYAHATELADELHAFLEGRVVRSHRTGLWVEIRSWTRRNRWLAMGIVAGLLVASGAVVAFVMQQRRAAVAIGEQRDVAVAAAARATAAQRRSDGLRLAAQSSDALSRDPGLALAMAVEASRLAPGPETSSAIYRALRPHRELAFLAGHEGYAKDCRFLADGRRLFSTDETGLAILWDTQAAEGVRWFDDTGGMIVDFAIAADEGTAAFAHAEGKVALFDLASGAPRGTIDVAATALAVAPDATWVVAERGGAVRRWRMPEAASTPLGEHAGGAWLATGAAAGASHVVSLGADGRLVAHDLAGGAGWSVVDPSGVPAKPVDASVFWARVSTVAGRVLVRWPDGTQELRDLATGANIGAPTPRGAPTDAAFSADGRSLFLQASEGAATRVEVRDPADGRVRTTFPCLQRTWSPSPDGRSLAAIEDSDVVVFDVERGVERFRLKGHRYHVATASWSPDGRRLASPAHDSSVRVWEIRRATERDALVERVRAGAKVLAIADSGETALLVSGVGATPLRTLEVVDTASGASLSRVELPTAAAERAGFMRAGRAVGWIDGSTWNELDVATGRAARSTRLAWPPGAEALGRALASPDGRLVAVRNEDYLRVFEAETGRLRSTLGDAGAFGRPMWHPDGRRLVLAQGSTGESTLYDTTSGRAIRTFRGHTGFVLDAEIEPAGRRLASSAVDSSVRVFDVETGALLARTTGLPMTGNSVDFGPDGTRLVHVATEFTLFDSTPGAPLVELATLARGPDQRELRLHPDGRRFWTSDDEQRVRAWELDARRAGEHAMSRPLLPIDRVQFDAGRALAADGVSAPYFARRDPWWAHQRGLLELSAGDVDAALASGRAALERRPGWARPRMLVARALAAQAARPSARPTERASLADAARTELEKAFAAPFHEQLMPPGTPPPSEFTPFLDDAGFKDVLRRLGCDFGD